VAELKARHESELQRLSSQQQQGDDGLEQESLGAQQEEDGVVEGPTRGTGGQQLTNEETTDDDAMEVQRQKKAEKARRKREKAREKERERERRIAEETANAGPSPRDVENQVIEKLLLPLNLAISEVEADGHCLYRAVALQCDSDYLAMRTFAFCPCGGRCPSPSNLFRCDSSRDSHVEMFLPDPSFTTITRRIVRRHFVGAPRPLRAVLRLV